MNHHLVLCKDFDFKNKITVNQRLQLTGRFCSGICHHIMYNRNIIDELINKIETLHSKTFWKIYLNLVDTRDKDYMKHCEPANCELYFNYI